MTRYAVIDTERLREAIYQKYGTYQDGASAALIDEIIQRTLSTLLYQCIHEDPRLDAMMALWEEKGDET